MRSYYCIALIRQQNYKIKFSLITSYILSSTTACFRTNKINLWSDVLHGLGVPEPVPHRRCDYLVEN